MLTISSKVCIARVFDRFNIDYSGFISRVPNWIHQGMGELDLFVALQDAVVEDSVVDYKCIIPPQTKELMAVEYEGWRLDRIEGINTAIPAINAEIYHPYAKYELSNGYIITTFETGDVRIYIKVLPIELDANLKLYFPLIPDNEDVLTALDWYILKRLLERGHLVPNFSLKDNNEFTNPALAWEKYKKIARNSVINIDSDTRSEISKILRTFIVDYNYHKTVEFNPYYTE